MKPEHPTLSVEASEESVRTWVSRTYVGNELREQLSQADVLLVPKEGYREQTDRVYFPSGTEEFFHFMKESKQGNLSVEICIEDEDYEELSLYADWLVIADLVVKSLAVNLIWGYIKRRTGKRETETIVKSKLTVHDEATGYSVDLFYEGPAPEYRDTVMRALQQNPTAHRASDSEETNPSGYGELGE